MLQFSHLHVGIKTVDVLKLVCEISETVCVTCLRMALAHNKSYRNVGGDHHLLQTSPQRSGNGANPGGTLQCQPGGRGGKTGG